MILTVFRPKRIKKGKIRIARSYRGRYRLNGDEKISDVPLHASDKRIALQRLEQIVKEKQLEAVGILPSQAKETLNDEKGAPLVKLVHNRLRHSFCSYRMGGFAGLRSIEILRLEWEDVWFEKGFIEVGREKSKTATRRLVPICPALEAWLKPRAKESGHVLPDIRNEVHFTRLFHAAKGTLNDEKGAPRVKLVHNGLRHSFCSLPHGGDQKRCTGGFGSRE